MTTDGNIEAQPYPSIYYNQESGTYQPLDGDLILHSLADVAQLHRAETLREFIEWLIEKEIPLWHKWQDGEAFTVDKDPLDMPIKEYRYHRDPNDEYLSSYTDDYGVILPSGYYLSASNFYHGGFGTHFIEVNPVSLYPPADIFVFTTNAREDGIAGAELPKDPYKLTAHHKVYLEDDQVKAMLSLEDYAQLPQPDHKKPTEPATKTVNAQNRAIAMMALLLTSEKIDTRTRKNIRAVAQQILKDWQIEASKYDCKDSPINEVTLANLSSG